MVFLYILLGIIAFIALILSVRITINGEFFDEFKLNIKWLFINLQILPANPKKDKPPKKEKPKKEKPQEETVEEPAEPTEKKDNIFVRFYNNQGFDGVVELINNAAKDLGKMFSSFKKHIVLRKLYLWMTISSGDAAQTALDYGRICQKVFPALSFICTNLTVKKYDVEIEPDYLGLKNKAQFAFSVSIRPIFFINAVIVLALRLVFNVVIKFLKGAKNNKKNNENINEGGAL